MHVLEHEKGDGPTSESHGQGNRGERGQSKDRAEAQPVRTHGLFLTEPSEAMTFRIFRLKIATVS